MRDICSGWTPKSDSCVEMDFLGPEHCGRVSIILFAHGLKSALSWEEDQRTYSKIETHHKVHTPLIPRSHIICSPVLGWKIWNAQLYSRNRSLFTSACNLSVDAMKLPPSRRSMLTKEFDSGRAILIEVSREHCLS
jgi:hypothetical protein